MKIFCSGITLMLLFSGFSALRRERNYVMLTPTVKNEIRDEPRLRLGIVLPHSNFRWRDYNKAIYSALVGWNKTRPRFEFLSQYVIGRSEIDIAMMPGDPSPMTILNLLCERFLKKNVSTILYFTNAEHYEQNVASTQYFLQLTGYLGIPVITWNADNFGVEKTNSTSKLILRLAPTLTHQAEAMLSILERYSWHQFSIVTSEISGQSEFIQALREKTSIFSNFKFNIQKTIKANVPEDLDELRESETRIILLYCTREEARNILIYANKLGLTGRNYMWITTKSVIGNIIESPPEFPVGMLGLHFDTSDYSMIMEITTAMNVFAHGVELFTSSLSNANISLVPSCSCDGMGKTHWEVGENLYRLLQPSISPNFEFQEDGSLKVTELRIMNLRPTVTGYLQWEEIGTWRSWKKDGLDIKDIVWPGYSHVPPDGVPEKFHLKITFLEEFPFINLALPDPETGKCTVNRGVFCRVSKESYHHGMSISQAHKNQSLFKCCSGFSIDLLEKLAEELSFTYELNRVEDGKWGTLINGKWNGLIAALVNHKTDMVMTALKVNSDRENYIDFSIPIFETGITVIVAKRTGIISPTAFLEPFDTASWMLVAFVAIQVSALAIFLFEWLSPVGFNMKTTTSKNSKFSLLRSYWLVWAVLFQAAVNVDCPKGYTARFMAHVWAMFAVVFLAIYTANLAAFMITREEFYDINGIEDQRLNNPFFTKPPFKFGTIPHGNTEAVLRRNYPNMYMYMKQYNRNTVTDGINAIKKGELDAFIYDAIVLKYLEGQDYECRLLTVGEWYAMTSFAIGFPRGSKYVEIFNKKLLEYNENGEIERLIRFWMRSICNPRSQNRSSSKPLSLEQFLSAFLLLASGIVLALCLLFLEGTYFNYIQKRKRRGKDQNCCGLISLSMGHSMSQCDIMDGHRLGSCQDIIVIAQLWKTKHELEVAKDRICRLEQDLRRLGYEPSESMKMSQIAEIETVL